MMRRLICLMLAMLLCASLVVSAFATESVFTPSVPAKDKPTIVEIKDNQGANAIGVTSGGVDSFIYEDCLLLTAVSEAKKGGSTLETYDEEAHALLLEVYEALKSGEMQIPYEKFSLDPNNMVIRDLFDASWLCEDLQNVSAHPDNKGHEEIVAPEGVVFTFTLDLGVASDEKVHVFTYKNHEFEENGERSWDEIVDVVNNGDGTVTSTFEHLCVIAVCIETDGKTGSNSATSPSVGPYTGDQFGQNLSLWIGLIVVSAVALVVILVMINKKKKH